MCTVTFRHDEAGYRLLFNRDERRTRSPGRPPAPGLDASFLAPRDAQAGGTWIGVDRHGLTLGLLNRYPSLPTTGAMRSRGLLIPSLLERGACAPTELGQQLSGLELAFFRPFTLLAVWPRGPACAWAWGESELTTREVDGFLTSTSAAVTLESRRADFDALVAAEASWDAWRELHRSHRPERGPSSVCMHRPEARTVSWTEVVVEAERVSMAYGSGPPCRTPLAAPVTLPRLGSEGCESSGWLR